MKETKIYMEPIVARMKLRIKSMIWNISKTTTTTLNQSSKKKKEPPRNMDGLRSLWENVKYTNI